MTTTERKIIKVKVGLLELAKQLRSVTQACRVMEYNRDSFIASETSANKVAMGHVRQCGGNCGVAEMPMGHAATVAIWAGTASGSGGVSSDIASVCM